ncbi:GNAT family N-acetyltransferase [Methylocella silvestris]|uniref:GNAT family N-acetyltransferase n=1 Tax=Methylocella silvestris TaxID=199596 RepID=A0A2J7TFA0_METSI|nr:GNAT family N-acetyltransferase [Methylocella silvestris]PNG25451.1 GNAT family N-acetyltransferase [Methylocella silvestris]
MSTLRRAGSTDVEALAALARRTWREMSLVDFAMPYSAEDIAAFEGEKSSEAVVRARLLDRDQATWVIDDEGKLIGYADAGPCSLPHPDVAASDMELNRLYVSRAKQGQGHGGRLMQAALAWMGTRSAGAQWIGVWSGNRKAQAFYAAYGFETVGEYDFPIGQWIDRDFIMRRTRPSQ